MPVDSRQQHHSQKLFGRRKARTISQYRQNLLNNMLPKITIPQNKTIKLNTKQNNQLEIGFGNGEHLIQIAQKYPQINLIGCEVFINGIANILTQIKKYNINNIKIFNNDARLLLPLIPDNSLDAIYVLFPDPWHKNKHHKRRLIQQQTINQFNRILKNNATLHIATDNANYAQHTLINIITRKQNHNLKWTAQKPQHWKNPPPQHSQTKYEKKAIKNNKQPFYLNFIKSP